MIDTEQQWNPQSRIAGERLQGVGQIDGGAGGWHIFIADISRAHQMLFHQHAGGIELIAGEGQHEHLPDFLFDGHGGDCGLDGHNSAVLSIVRA